MTESRMPGLRGLKSRESKHWDLSLNLEKRVLEELDQLPPRSQWGQRCPDPGQLQIQVLGLLLLGVLQNYFCFPAVEYFQEGNDLGEPFAGTLEAPFFWEDDVDQRPSGTLYLWKLGDLLVFVVLQTWGSF